ncbi:hypothetical protein GCK32_000710 [Trichostrongylus colubriformis]|uniref:Uncharacterized protein n=1 Tax=Trichostrongylus colubriformis TaxID=6319 RepID=A0AAN8FHM7_TRICO
MLKKVMNRRGKSGSSSFMWVVDEDVVQFFRNFRGSTSHDEDRGTRRAAGFPGFIEEVLTTMWVEDPDVLHFSLNLQRKFFPLCRSRTDMCCTSAEFAKEAAFPTE